MGNIEEINSLLASIPKKVKKKQEIYKKPESIKLFEEEYFDFKYSSKQFMPINTRVKDKFSDKKANDLQKLIVKFFEMRGSFASRINSTGSYRADLKKFVRGTQKKGISDVQALHKGVMWMLEVKIGKDKPREEQLRVQQHVRNSGGIYEFIHSFDEFLEVYNKYSK